MNQNSGSLTVMSLCDDLKMCDAFEAKLRKERGESQNHMEAVVKGLLDGAVAGKVESNVYTPIKAEAIHLK